MADWTSQFLGASIANCKQVFHGNRAGERMALSNRGGATMAQKQSRSTGPPGAIGTASSEGAECWIESKAAIELEEEESRVVSELLCKFQW
jgi:hypothetical protein